MFFLLATGIILAKDIELKVILLKYALAQLAPSIMAGKQTKIILG
jgi:hypothetical protein